MWKFECCVEEYGGCLSEVVESGRLGFSISRHVFQRDSDHESEPAKNHNPSPKLNDERHRTCIHTQQITSHSTQSCRCPDDSGKVCKAEHLRYFRQTVRNWNGYGEGTLPNSESNNDDHDGPKMCARFVPD